MHLSKNLSRTLYLTVLIGLVSAANAADWPGWRGPRGNGISLETSIDPDSLNGDLKVTWQAQVGIGYSSIAVADDVVYTMGNVGNVDTVYALRARSGREIWSYSYRCSLGGYPGPRATPAVDEGRVYTLSREGHLFCFDADSGKVLWSAHLADDYRMIPPDWGFAGSPVIYEDLVLLNAGKSGMALNKRTGDPVWVSEGGSGSYAAPVVYPYDRGTAVALFGSRSLYGVNVRTGELLWSYPWRTSPSVNAADPVVSGSRAFIASAYNQGSALIDFSTGNPTTVWRSDIFETHFSSFLLIDGYLYGNDGDARRSTSGTYRCVDFETGEVSWSQRAGFGSIIAVGGYLITLDYKGTITVAETDPTKFVALSSASLPRGQFWTPPAYADGFLYCRDLKGNLYRVDMR